MISLFKKKEAPVYPADTVTSRDGRPIVFTFFKHASLAVDFDGRRIYVDPVGEYADYAHLPKADAVLVTHSHYDHLDRAAVEQLMTPATAVVCDKTSAEAFDFDCYTMVPGALWPNLSTESASRRWRLIIPPKGTCNSIPGSGRIAATC